LTSLQKRLPRLLRNDLHVVGVADATETEVADEDVVVVTISQLPASQAMKRLQLPLLKKVSRKNLPSLPKLNAKVAGGVVDAIEIVAAVEVATADTRTSVKNLLQQLLRLRQTNQKSKVVTKKLSSLLQN